MFRHTFFVFFTISLFITAACNGSTDWNKEHKIDPETDVIIGKEDAEHEMVVYFSPGCPHCLTTYKETFPVIKEKYIDTGKLRVVFREIPAIIPDTSDKLINSNIRNKEALNNSITIGLSMRCAAHYHDNDAYIKVLDTFVNTLETELNSDAIKNWPYLNRRETQALFYNIGKEGTLDPEQYKSCVAGSLRDEFAKIYAHYGDIFQKDLGLTAVPVYYLDSKKLELSETDDPKTVILEALEEKIGS